MIARYASAVSSGTFVTFALLYVMQLLISLQPGAATEGRERIPVIFGRDKVEEPPVQPRETIIPREALTKLVAEPQRLNNTGTRETIGVRSGVPIPPTGGGITDFNPIVDGPLVNIVRVRPVYPVRAIAQEIEGHVIVQFDVTAEGRVVNAVVIESTSSLLDRSAIKAAERFKFKPRVVDGIALASTGIQNLFTYRLDEQ